MRERDKKQGELSLVLKIPSSCCCEVSVSQCRDVAVFSSREFRIEKK